MSDTDQGGNPHTCIGGKVQDNVDLFACLKRHVLVIVVCVSTERDCYDTYGLLQLFMQQKWHRVSYTIESMYAGLPIAGLLSLNTVFNICSFAHACTFG